MDEFPRNRLVSDRQNNGPAPSSPSRKYVYGGSALLAKIAGSTTTYYHQDHLSNRLVTGSTGSTLAQMGHYPFGYSWYNTTNDKLQFTSYERDAESGNDYAMARTYINRLGRFSSLDPLSGSPSDPQSLNLYSYVRNSPTNLTDLKGTCPTGGSQDLAFGGGAMHAICTGAAANRPEIVTGDPNQMIFMGYTIWDALTGAPGTYVSGFDDNGNLQWGFSPDKWQSDYASQTSKVYDFGIANPDRQEQQKELAVVKFGEQACPGQSQDAITSCIQQVYDTIGNPVAIEGGNFEFSYANIKINDQSVNPNDFGCFQSRCGTINSLDYSHGDGTFHVDTGNVWFVPIGTIFHVVVDVLGGNTWWSGGIPRSQPSP